jgi:hypothetical protein
MNLTNDEGRFICTMCFQLVDIDQLEDEASMRELLISGLCMDCQIALYDPADAAAPCCEMHQELGYIDPECITVLMIQAGIEYEPTTQRSREEEALNCEGLPFEHFTTDEVWYFKMLDRVFKEISDD